MQHWAHLIANGIDAGHLSNIGFPFEANSQHPQEAGESYSRAYRIAQQSGDEEGQQLASQVTSITHSRCVCVLCAADVLLACLLAVLRHLLPEYESPEFPHAINGFDGRWGWAPATGASTE